jgi:hypothetical protein
VWSWTMATGSGLRSGAVVFARRTRGAWPSQIGLRWAGRASAKRSLRVRCGRGILLAGTAFREVRDAALIGAAGDQIVAYPKLDTRAGRRIRSSASPSAHHGAAGRSRPRHGQRGFRQMAALAGFCQSWISEGFPACATRVNRRNVRRRIGLPSLVIGH